MALMQQVEGNFHFLPGAPNGPFSAAVVAVPGYELVRATLRTPLPYEAGFEAIERHMAARGRPRAALSAVELRCSTPYEAAAFAAFNAHYRSILERWGVLVDGYSPAARSNIAPAFDPPKEQMLAAFTYSVPSSAANSPPTFVVSGAPEGPGVHPGETSVAALRDKTRDILAKMDAALAALTVSWDDVTGMNLYTVESVQPFLSSDILSRMGPAAQYGVTWYYARPPVVGFDIEIDIRGIRHEIRLN